MDLTRQKITCLTRFVPLGSSYSNLTFLTSQQYIYLAASTDRAYFLNLCWLVLSPLTFGNLYIALRWPLPRGSISLKTDFFNFNYEFLIQMYAKNWFSKFKKHTFFMLKIKNLDTICLWRFTKWPLKRRHPRGSVNINVIIGS